MIRVGLMYSGQEPQLQINHNYYDATY